MDKVDFVDSSVFTEDESKLNTAAYRSELDHSVDGTELMKLGDEEIKKGIGDMLALGYSREAIDRVMAELEKDDRVVLPHHIRYYREFKSIEDACKHYGYDSPERMRGAEYHHTLSNGHVLVWCMHQEIQELLDQYL